MFMLSTLIPALAVSVPTAVSEPATDRLVSSFALVTASSAIEAVTTALDASCAAPIASSAMSSCVTLVFAMFYSILNYFNFLVL